MVTGLLFDVHFTMSPSAPVIVGVVPAVVVSLRASWRPGLALIGLFCVLPTVVAIQLAGGTWAEVADFDGEVQLYQFTPDAEDGAAGAP